jgi:poly(A) polymerase
MKKELAFKSKYLDALMQILNSRGKARVVGGSVRDALLGKDPCDIDIATTLLPQEVTTLLNDYPFEQNNVHNIKRISIIPTGLKHGTVTAIIQDEKFEITTLRRDLNCDGRWATVEFTDDFREDAERRDFTINALSYCCLTNEIFDYFNGLQHLENRQVVFIKNPIERINEDHLRIFRFFRFSAYYANSLDLNGLEDCNSSAHLVKTLARERINAEFDKILLAPNNAINTLKSMRRVIAHTFENLELSITFLEQILELQQILKLQNVELDEIYGVLFSSNKTINFGLLKFSNKRKQTIIKIRQFIFEETSETVVYAVKTLWTNLDNVKTFILLALAASYITIDVAKALLSLTSENPPKFPIDGIQIKKLGYVGKDIGNVLNYLRSLWILKDFKITEKELITCLKNY